MRQLDDLSEQIRSYIMDQLSLSGGYLSSNLGVIEMTVALHYCFDTPMTGFFSVRDISV